MSSRFATEKAEGAGVTRVRARRCDSVLLSFARACTHAIHAPAHDHVQQPRRMNACWLNAGREEGGDLLLVYTRFMPPHHYHYRRRLPERALRQRATVRPSLFAILRATARRTPPRLAGRLSGMYRVVASSGRTVRLDCVARASATQVRAVVDATTVALYQSLKKFLDSFTQSTLARECFWDIQIRVK